VILNILRYRADIKIVDADELKAKTV